MITDGAKVCLITAQKIANAIGKKTPRKMRHKGYVIHKHGINN